MNAWRKDDKALSRPITHGTFIRHARRSLPSKKVIVRERLEGGGG